MAHVLIRRLSLSGNLSTKSLASVVDPAVLVQGSEYLESHLIAVPKASRKEFLQSYERLAELVVPRSSTQVAEDDEFVLFSVVTFQKTSADFLTKCREQKWIPRQLKGIEGGEENEQRQLDRAVQEEKKAWAEAIRMVVTGWSEIVQVWLHIITLRVFVEAVLRYGLPLDYVNSIIKVCVSKQAETRLHEGGTLRLLINGLDNAEDDQKGEDNARFELLISRRERSESGQAGERGR